MRFDIVTIFPEFFAGPLSHGILRRAREAGLIDAQVHDLRDFTHDRHRTVDDRPFGGGEGMVLKPEPLFEAVEKLLGNTPTLSAKGAERMGHPNYGAKTAVVLLSASGKVFRQGDARRLAQLQRVVLLCGRYEGVDERVAEHLATDEFSIGDFVLSGGELPAAMVVDAVTRLLPGALGNEASSVHESFSQPPAGIEGPAVPAFGVTLNSSNMRWMASMAESFGSGRGILDCPHYTRPQEFRGWAVPDVLVGGNHEQVRRWRRKMALAKTFRNRRELLAGSQLDEEDLALIKELVEEDSTAAGGAQ